MNVHFDVETAKRYGIEAACIYDTMTNYTRTTEPWFPHEFFEDFLSFMTSQKIRTAVRKLIKAGLVVEKITTVDGVKNIEYALKKVVGGEYKCQITENIII